MSAAGTPSLFWISWRKLASSWGSSRPSSSAISSGKSAKPATFFVVPELLSSFAGNGADPAIRCRR